MRHREVAGLPHFPAGRATVRELTIGELHRLRAAPDGEVPGLRFLSTALVDPEMSVAELEALGGSAMVELERLTQAVLDLQRPEEPGDPPA